MVRSEARMPVSTPRSVHFRAEALVSITDNNNTKKEKKEEREKKRKEGGRKEGKKERNA